MFPFIFLFLLTSLSLSLSLSLYLPLSLALSLSLSVGLSLCCCARHEMLPGRTPRGLCLLRKMLRLQRPWRKSRNLCQSFQSAPLATKSTPQAAKVLRVSRNLITSRACHAICTSGCRKARRLSAKLISQNQHASVPMGQGPRPSRAFRQASRPR